MKKLDNKDYLLLDLLSEGSRKNISQIANKLRLHENSILYRIKRLKKMQIIRNFSFISEVSAIGKDTFYVFFRLKLNDEDKKQVYNYLEKHPRTLLVSRLTGTWNVLIELICDDFKHFNDELAEITGYLGDRISDYMTVLLYVPYKVSASIKFKQDYAEAPPTISEKVISLDVLDKKILGLLCDNSDLSYKELAKEADTTLDKVFYRIKKLTKQRLIQKFVPIVNLENLGYQRYVVSLKFSDITKKKFDSMKLYLISNRNVFFAFRTAGDLGVVFFCAYKNNSDLDNFLTNLSSNFGDIVREQKIHIVSEILKFNYFPEGLRK